jgi:hypothetical protein
LLPAAAQCKKGAAWNLTTIQLHREKGLRVRTLCAICNACLRMRADPIDSPWKWWRTWPSRGIRMGTHGTLLECPPPAACGLLISFGTAADHTKPDAQAKPQPDLLSRPEVLTEYRICSKLKPVWSCRRMPGWRFGLVFFATLRD